MSVKVRDPRFRSVVGDDVAFEQLATGCLFTEGPIWHPTDHHLTFSDIPAGRIRRWHVDGTVATFRDPSDMANGNTYDRQGRMLTCTHATSRVTRVEADGSTTVLASHHDGKELNSPNDIVVGGDGAIYFTDPTYGRIAYYGVARDCELPYRGVYRIDPGDPGDGGDGGDGGLTLLADDFDQPNGLCFSPDESRLFVNDSEGGHIRVFDRAADGGWSGGGVWAETTGDGAGSPDGMKTDSDGNVYCTGPGGIHVFAPDAACLGVIHVPEHTANMAFGDADLRGLFVTASTSLYRGRVAVPGLPLF